jgi:hypothetical protein
MFLIRPILSATSAYTNLLQILSPYEFARNGWRLSISISFNFKYVLYFSNWHVFYDKSECQLERDVVGNGRDLPITLSRNLSENSEETLENVCQNFWDSKTFRLLLWPVTCAIVTEAGGWKARIAGKKLVTVIPKHSSCLSNEHKLRECQFLFRE